MEPPSRKHLLRPRNIQLFGPLCVVLSGRYGCSKVDWNLHFTFYKGYRSIRISDMDRAWETGRFGDCNAAVESVVLVTCLMFELGSNSAVLHRDHGLGGILESCFSQAEKKVSCLSGVWYPKGARTLPEEGGVDWMSEITLWRNGIRRAVVVKLLRLSRRRSARRVLRGSLGKGDVGTLHWMWLNDCQHANWAADMVSTM